MKMYKRKKEKEKGNKKIYSQRSRACLKYPIYLNCVCMCYMLLSGKLMLRISKAIHNDTG